MVFGGSEGGLAWPVLHAASLLAAHGHPALALAWFGEPGLPARLRNIPLEYFRRGLEWLRAQPQVHGRRAVVEGASFGGQAALLIGATYPALVRGVVALVPDDWVDTAPGIGSHPAWTLHGDPVPTGPIPVQRIRGPIFAVGGGDDRLWPSGQHVAGLEQDLAGHGPPPTLLVYPRAGLPSARSCPTIRPSPGSTARTASSSSAGRAPPTSVPAKTRGRGSSPGSDCSPADVTPADGLTPGRGRGPGRRGSNVVFERRGIDGSAASSRSTRRTSTGSSA
jgi:dienelactone hydrolase